MKKSLSLLLALVMVLSLMAFAPAAGAEDAHEPIVLEFSQTATQKEHHGACWGDFAEYVHEHCPWITINVHDGSELYDDSTFCEAIMRGNVEMGITAARIIAGRIRGDTTLPKRVLLPSRLIERDSV